MEFRSLRKSSKKYFAKLFLGLMLFEEFLLLLKGQMSHTGTPGISVYLTNLISFISLWQLLKCHRPTGIFMNLETNSSTKKYSFYKLPIKNKQHDHIVSTLAILVMLGSYISTKKPARSLYHANRRSWPHAKAQIASILEDGGHISQHATYQPTSIPSLNSYQPSTIIDLRRQWLED